MHLTLLLSEQCSAASATMALELLTAANLFSGQPIFQIVTASLDGAPVRTLSGQTLQAQSALAEIINTDLVLIPGFLFTLRDALPGFGRYSDWLRARHQQGTVLAAMCTGAFMLAETGLLDGGRATTHWEDLADLRAHYPALDVQEHVRWVDQGALITSAGISAGIDMSLHLVSRLGGAALAERTARQMDTPWNPLP